MDEEADLNTAGSHDLGGSIPSPSGLFEIDEINSDSVVPFYDLDLPDFNPPIVFEISKIKI